MKVKIEIPADPRLIDALGTIARELRRIADALERAHPPRLVPFSARVVVGRPTNER